MFYIKGQNISFKYENQAENLFENLNFEIGKNHKIGLVRDNGVGKSTLIKIIREEFSCEGNLNLKDDISIGYLTQELIFENEDCLDEYLVSFDEELSKLKKIINRSEDDIKVANAVVKFDLKGGFDYDSLIHKNLGIFDLTETDLTRKLASFSGGEKTRIAIFRIMIQSIDMLILDEPTNNLDIEILVWLENYLIKLDLPFLLVSHNRKFLDRVVNKIWCIKDKRLEFYSGNYSDYKRFKAEDLNRKILHHTVVEKKIKKLSKQQKKMKNWASSFQNETKGEGYAPVYEDVTNSAKKSMHRAKVMKQRIQKMLDKANDEKPFMEKERHFMIASSKLRKKSLLRIENLSFAYGSRLLLDNFSLEVNKGETIGIMGRNGCGKTSFLKILVHQIRNFTGTVNWTNNIKISYYDQEYENLNLENKILDEITDKDKEKDCQARTLLACLKMKREIIREKIDNLSVGEKSKVSLAKAILQNPDILLLDEPTNHLEISVIEELERALKDYNGALIVVSHDKVFLNNISSKIINFS